MSNTALRFDNRVAIVTGSGRGLGREYALLLARLGAAVVVNSITTATANSTIKDITEAGGTAVAHVGSVADREVAIALVEAAILKFGRIDIIINNAGTAQGSDFDSTPDSQLWDMLGVHVGGSWNVTQAAWPYMKSQHFGRVIMITSPLIFGGAQQSAYGAAKIALVGLAKSIAIEGKQHNIAINTVAPMGYTPGSAVASQDEQVQNIMKAYMPADSVAPTVAWLVHEDCKVTGEAFAAVNRLVTRIFLAETKGFFGSLDQDWTIETVRNNWDKVVDETDYAVHTDIAEFSPKIIRRLTTGQ